PARVEIVQTGHCQGGEEFSLIHDLLLLNRLHVIDEQVDPGVDLFPSKLRLEDSSKRTRLRRGRVAPNWHLPGTMGGHGLSAIDEIAHLPLGEDTFAVL